MVVDILKDLLLIKARNRVKVTSTKFDNDISQLVSEALADIKRIGITIDESTENPLIEGAVLSYVIANFGINPKREEYLKSYDMFLTKLKGSVYYVKKRFD